MRIPGCVLWIYQSILTLQDAFVPAEEFVPDVRSVFVARDDCVGSLLEHFGDGFAVVAIEGDNCHAG